MTIRFTARHMSGGTEHEHVASLQWIKDGTNETKSNTRAQLVDWIDNKGGKAYAADTSGGSAWVKVVQATPPYLRTQKDGVWTDNLLALPTY
jgi:hypothetical protein